MGLCPTMEPSTPFVQRPSFACRINQLPARKNWPWLQGSGEQGQPAEVVCTGSLPPKEDFGERFHALPNRTNSGWAAGQPAVVSPSRPAASSLARAALATARRARFSRRSARRARLALEGRRSARCRARSALATSRSARLLARSSRALATSARRRRRQARNLEASGQRNQASAPAPARRNAPLLPCSTPYQAPKTTTGMDTA